MVLYIKGHWRAGGLYAIDPQTRQEHQVAPIERSFETFDLSPDNRRVVFNSTTGGVVNLWMLQLDDGKTKQLTFDRELLGFPSWSPDGKWIAAEMKRGPETNIVLVPSAGGPVKQITSGPGENWPHSWSPSGDRIFYARREPAGTWNIWSISSTTLKQKQLTNYDKANMFVRYPSISPRGNQLVYESTESTGNIWMLEFK
jgi:Tol biopolymer transport system component